jgi:gliding motility-associated-like protein
MRLLSAIIISLLCTTGYAIEKGIKYIENKGQWDEHIDFKAHIPSGELYLESNRLTYVFIDSKKLHDSHHQHEEGGNCSHHTHGPIDAHAFRLEFLNTLSPEIKGEDVLTAYHNYLLGNDPNNWHGQVPLFEQVSYKNIYQDIDLKLYSEGVNFKYDFILEPNADPSQIQLQYTGVSPVLLDNGNIEIDLGFNKLQEQKPYAYQIIKGKQQQVSCNYVLEDNILSFEFPEGYDNTKELVIDPVLVVATYSGLTGPSGYGHTATYDFLGNIYSGGQIHGVGYPTTTGAFQVNYAGGSADIGVNKYNDDGSALVWATYLGGSDRDLPQSLVVSNIGELYVFGTTSSTDYPLTANAFQDTLKPTPNSWNGSGTDHVISRLSQDGSTLLGSTYLGGTDEEKLSGEIIVDPLGNALIASSTQSADYPTSASAPYATFNGTPNWTGTGIAAKLSSNMSNLLWSTYTHDSLNTPAYSIHLDNSNQNIYVCGEADSGYVATANAATQNSIGGTDGYIILMNASGTNILNSTLFGSNLNEGAKFIDIDILGHVYITGNTQGIIPITPGCYGVQNTDVFIAKFNAGLSTLIWQTTIGDSTSAWGNSFSPNAFMVDKCRKIYVGGFGAMGNTMYTTSNAFFTATSPNVGYYMTALEPNASSVNFASYFEGDHVDGGTSRFDPTGVVYQAVCSPNTITATPNAYSTNQNGTYDVTVFKVDFQATSVNALAMAGPSTTGCLPLTVNFTNASTAASFYWDFDDNGATSTDTFPSHTFVNPGVYNVMLIAIDSNSCNITDTFFIQVNASDTLGNFNFTHSDACFGNDMQFEATGGSNADLYSWDFGDGTTANVMNPVHQYSAAGTYTVTLIIDCACAAVDTIIKQVTVTPMPIVDLGADTLICPGESIDLNAANSGSSYLWSNGFNGQGIQVNSAGSYHVQVSSGDCTTRDTIIVGVDQFSFDLGPDTTFCSDQFTFTMDAGPNGINYLWSTGETTQSITVSTANAYQVNVTSPNNCVYTDVLNIGLFDQPIINFVASSQEECDPGYISFSDLSTCNSGVITEWEWYFEGINNGSTAPHPYTIWNKAGTFDVGLSVTTSKGCSDSIILRDYITINPQSVASFTFTPREVDRCNPTIELNNTSTFYDSCFWQFGDGNSSVEAHPSHTYKEADRYMIELYTNNEFNCADSTSFPINPNDHIPLYVPTAFTPEKDMHNEEFKAYSACIKDFQMQIFSQWGQLIFSSTDIEEGWDGTYLGKDCPTGVYTWKISYTGAKHNQKRTGTVSLMR